MWVALGCFAIVAIAGLVAFLSRCPVMIERTRETRELCTREVHTSTHVVYVDRAPQRGPTSAIPVVPLQHMVQAPARGQVPPPQRSKSPRAPRSRTRLAGWQR